jgi:hypothetical protein
LLQPNLSNYDFIDMPTKLQKLLDFRVGSSRRWNHWKKSWKPSI